MIRNSATFFGTCLSNLKLLYIAQPLKLKFNASLFEPFFTMMGPESRIQLLFVLWIKNDTFLIATSAIFTFSKTLIFKLSLATIKTTSSNSAIFLINSTKAHWMAAYLPGQSSPLCGEHSKTACCVSHSAGNLLLIEEAINLKPFW